MQPDIVQMAVLVCIAAPVVVRQTARQLQPLESSCARAADARLLQACTETTAHLGSLGRARGLLRLLQLHLGGLQLSFQLAHAPDCLPVLHDL